MASTPIGVADPRRYSTSARADRGARWAWLLAAGALAVVACGGRWDVALAAWALPICLLRFSRTSSLPAALAGVIGVALVQNIAWFLLTAIPLNPLTAALCLIVSVAYSLPAILDRTLGGRLSTGGRLFLFPVAAVAVEFGVGSVLPVGTALGMRAITQGDNLALLQVTAITGPYAIAFLIGWGATVANRLLERPSVRTLARSGAPFAATLAIVVAAGQLRLMLTPAEGAIVRVAAITPDLDRRLALDDQESTAADSILRSPRLRMIHSEIVRQLLDETQRAAAGGARIVSWSETGASALADEKPTLLAEVSAAARRAHIYIDAAVGVAQARNETFLFGPDGRLLWHYRKNHPVPGIEPVPAFTDAPPVVTTPYGRLSNLICFDGDFPALARIDADLMLEPSWDWPEVAYAHTFRMIRLRAIENGYALAHPVFDGVTGVFDRLGRPLAVRETMDKGSHTVLADVPIGTHRTIYNRIGDVFAWGCALACAALIGLSLARRAHS